jgi:hypothetical protein
MKQIKSETMKKKSHTPEEIIRLLRECESGSLSKEKSLPAKEDFDADLASEHEAFIE